MFGSYGVVLRRPGALAFSMSGLVARMPISMIGLGTVLLVTAHEPSYALAGAMSATVALAASVGGPYSSRLCDRLGQHRVLPWFVALNVVALVALVLVVRADLPIPVWFATAILAGLSQPSIGSLVRTRWAAALTGTPRLGTAFAWESVLDEVIFVVGPPLATLLALQLFDGAAVLVAAALIAVGGTALSLLRHTEPVPTPRRVSSRGRPVLLRRGMVVSSLIGGLMGAIFGAFEVTTVAFAEEHGSPAATGVLLALYACGSLITGLAFGVVGARFAPTRVLRLALVALVVVSVPITVAGSVAVLAPMAFLAGLAVSPILISAATVVERLVPAAQLTEGLTWYNSALTIGLSVAASVSGAVIDATSASRGYLVLLASAALALAVALVGHRRLRGADATRLDTVERAEVVAPSAASGETGPPPGEQQDPVRRSHA